VGPLTTFEDLDLIDELLDALEDAGYTSPTPIQEKAIPPLLMGRDVLGVAQTGTGKTAAFSLPVLQLLHESPRGQGKRRIRTLVVTPTRELAAQIGDSFQRYGRHLDIKHRVIFGGVGQNPQVQALRAGIDVLVATPGRLLDLHQQGHVHLDHVDFFVLDEADRMLDMGFIHDMRKVMALLPQRRQNLLFSATMPPAIVKLAGSFLSSPIKVEVTPQSTTVELIDQQVMFVEKADKPRLLAHLLENPDMGRVIVFTRTKHGANRVVKHLETKGVLSAAIHGNKSQGARERALGGFRDGSIRVLVATDVAARGIDVPETTHVVNFDLPNIAESYVHRIGRTARAGRTGIAIAFCDDSEGGYLRDIERLTKVALDQITDHPYHCPHAVPGPNHRPTTPPDKKQQQNRGRRNPGRGGGGGRSGGRGGQRRR
jgi:ATP-dependent RNA helicase RhlE